MQRRVIKPQRPVYKARGGQAPKPYRPTVTLSSVKTLLKLAVLGGLAIMTYSWFNIRQIEVEGTKSLPPDAVRTKTETALGKGFFGENLLTLRPGQVTKDLQESEPLLKSVILERRWPNRLKVIIEERRPSLNWTSGNQTFLIDGDGTAIGPTTETGLANVVDSTNLPVKPGDKVVPRRFVEFIAALSSQIAVSGVKVTGYRVPDTTSEIYAVSEAGYIIKFDTTRGAAEQIADLAKVQQTLQTLRKTPAEYIDLRIPNKAYYR